MSDIISSKYKFKSHFFNVFTPQFITAGFRELNQPFDSFLHIHANDKQELYLPFYAASILPMSYIHRADSHPTLTL